MRRSKVKSCCFKGLGVLTTSPLAATTTSSVIDFQAFGFQRLAGSTRWKETVTVRLATARILTWYCARCVKRAARWQAASPLFEIARLLVRLDHVARFIVNANHSNHC